jgi:Domain of unknown function (DUF4430)
MSNTSNIVTVEVYGGPSATVPWEQGITALQAMERAQEVIEPNPDEQFTFALQYFTGIGYLVIMINETYDSFISRGGEKASPFFFWQFLVNGSPAARSVDNTELNAGDVVRFEFEIFVSERHRGTTLEAKFRQQTGASSS